MVNTNKILALIVCALLIMGVFAGCNVQQNNTPKNDTSMSQKEPTKVQESFPLKVKDSTGFEMTIEKKPGSIVSLTLGTDEMLLSIVDKSRIKALCGKIAEDTGISNVADKAEAFIKADNNIETVISLKPDIVFAADWMKKESIQQMRDAGINVYCYTTPTNIDEQRKTILNIAHIVGEDENGQNIVEDMDNKLKEIEEKVNKLSLEEKLTVLSYNSFGTTCSKGTTFDDIVARAGLINAASKANLDTYAAISKEKIIELNPDILFLPSYTYDKNKKASELVEQVKNDKSLSTVKAIKNNRVYILPENHMAAVSQYIVYGVEDAAKAAYPDLFK